MKETAEKKLSKLYNSMDSESQGHLLAFAEYLASQSQPERTEITKPKLVEGDADESVIQAIRRLSQCYPMLEKSRLLNDTSALMTQHMMQGRDRLEVIRELEVVFASHYQQYLVNNKEE